MTPPGLWPLPVQKQNAWTRSTHTIETTASWLCCSFRPVSQLTIDLTAGEQRGETVIDFVAAHSTVRGGFFVADDPGHAPLQGRALGFVEP